MANLKIREYAKDKKVFWWEVAIFQGCSEPTITRKLRTELSDEDSAKFKYAIDQISMQKEREV